MTDLFAEPPAGRPLWLMTLADLALLLVGFFVLVQATRHDHTDALASGLRARFGGARLAAPPPMPVAAAMMTFAPGTAIPLTASDDLVAWARDAARDPRVSLTVTGEVDGSAADRDPASGSATLLAADRARAAAAALVGVVPADRLVIATATHRGHRAALVTLAFTGDRP